MFRDLDYDEVKWTASFYTFVQSDRFVDILPCHYSVAAMDIPDVDLWPASRSASGKDILSHAPIEDETEEYVGDGLDGDDDPDVKDDTVEPEHDVEEEALMLGCFSLIVFDMVKTIQVFWCRLKGAMGCIVC